MIPLRLRTQFLPLVEPAVIRLLETAAEQPQPEDAVLVGKDNGWHDYDFQGFSLRIEAPIGETLDKDVVLAVPGQAIVHRLIRARSPHNTFLVTERCDQLCAFCSQPPKSNHVDLFDHFERAALLAPHGAVIGISGGEPTLFKPQLLNLLRRVQDLREDLGFHVLTNAQHFDDTDVDELTRLATGRVLWGIPIYAPTAAIHDELVGKDGAFSRLANGLGALMSSGANVELRTVVTRKNLPLLPDLARLIAVNLRFVSTWAIMQLEPIGYGRKNWLSLFADTGKDFHEIARAVNIVAGAGVNVALYNFPICTVPPRYRHFAAPTISDWKQKYIGVCDTCALKANCGGFFEWYDPDKGYERLGLT